MGRVVALARTAVLPYQCLFCLGAFPLVHAGQLHCGRWRVQIHDAGSVLCSCWPDCIKDVATVHLAPSARHCGPLQYRFFRWWKGRYLCITFVVVSELFVWVGFGVSDVRGSVLQPQYDDFSERAELRLAVVALVR
eukprot:SAG31_NODE_4575_length_3124_cov_2.054545_2_plen_136_part_00